MPNEIEASRVRMLRITAYLLGLAGILMLIPYPLFYSLKAILLASGARSFSPGKAFMGFLIAGQLVLCVPLLSIPFSAFWVWRETGSQGEHWYILSRGFFRYLPALILCAIEVIYTTSSRNFDIPGVFGALLISYSWILLKIDAPRAES
jgi:hypothetical protein